LLEKRLFGWLEKRLFGWLEKQLMLIYYERKIPLFR
jgi:hypothetical protein